MNVSSLGPVADEEPERLFTVITTTYNCVAKIDATAQSVFAQSGAALEFLVIDGGSSDGTVERLRSYGTRVRWLSEPDAGIYDAMNKGIRHARGRFLYFLGAGDCLRPHALRAVADRIPPPAGRLRMLYGDVCWPDHGGTYGGAFDAYRLAYHNICHQAIFYEREIFDLLGEYDLRYRFCADHVLNILCFGRPEVHPVHLDLNIADCEAAGASAGVDSAFIADYAALVRRHLGFWPALRTTYHCSRVGRGIARIRYHLKRPWRELPGRLRQRLRR